MVYGELRITPLDIDVQTRMISFWSNLIENLEHFKLSSCIYSAVHALHKEKKILIQSGDILFQIFCVCMGSLVFGIKKVLLLCVAFKPFG